MCCHNFSSYFLVLPSCVTFVYLASKYLICFTLKLWANFSPCFKASPLKLNEWGIAFHHIFQYDIQFFHHSSALFDTDQFSFLPSLGFNWYPGMENSLAFSEQPSFLRKVASFACKMSNCLDRSAVNLFLNDLSLSLLLRILE